MKWKSGTALVTAGLMMFLAGDAVDGIKSDFWALGFTLVAWFVFIILTETFCFYRGRGE